MLEHDPEKWAPVFRKRSCSNKKIERDDDSKKSHPALSRHCEASIERPQSERKGEHQETASKNRDRRQSKSLKPLRVEMDAQEHRGDIDHPAAVFPNSPDAGQKQRNRPADHKRQR